MDNQFMLNQLRLNLTSDHISITNCSQRSSNHPSPIYDYSNQEEKSREGLLSNSKKIWKNKVRQEKYHVISNESRLELIDSVMNKGEKMKQAASRLGINYSSAKSIFQIYKKEGRLEKKGSKSPKVKSTKTSEEHNLSSASSKASRHSSEETFSNSNNSSPKTASQESAVKLNRVLLLDFNSFDPNSISGNPSTCPNSACSSSQKCLKDVTDLIQQKHTVSITAPTVARPRLPPSEEVLTTLFSKIQEQNCEYQRSAHQSLFENNNILYQNLANQVKTLNELLMFNMNQKLALSREKEIQISLLQAILGNSPNLVSPLNNLIPQQNKHLSEPIRSCFLKPNASIPQFHSNFYL